MNRRQFSSAVAALGLNGVTHASRSVEVERWQLSRNGWMPNNQHLPVLLYRRAFQVSGDLARLMETDFRKNSWPLQWRNGVYPFHHYHSTAHEVLGFADGSATLMLGGDGGRRVKVGAGDVLLLPASTGHCRMEADSRFLVIGAYPPDQHWDICRTAPDAAATERMRSLPFPASDPVSGAAGELTQAWRA